VAVRNTAGLAIAKVACGEEIIAEGLEVCAVGGGRFSGAPELGQLELSVQVLKVRGARAKVGDVDVPTVDEAQLLGADGTDKVARGLGGPEAAAVGEGRDDIALEGVPDRRAEPGGQPEVPGPVDPLGSVREWLEDGTLRHRIDHLAGGFDGRRWRNDACDPLDDRPMVLVEADSTQQADLEIEPVRLVPDLIAQVPREPLGAARPAALMGVGGDAHRIVGFRWQPAPEIVIAQRAHDVDGAGLDGFGELEHDGNFEVSAIERPRIAFFMVGNKRSPARRQKLVIEVHEHVVVTLLPEVQID
jgi:hypothetical protein